MEIVLSGQFLAAKENLINFQHCFLVALHLIFLSFDYLV